MQGGFNKNAHRGSAILNVNPKFQGGINKNTPKGTFNSNN